MKLVIKLAMRNVRRNIKSTLLNGLGITLSVLVLLFVFSLSQGIESQIVSRNVKFETGALSVSMDKKTASYNNKQEGDMMLKEIVSILDKDKDIADYSPRVYIPNSTVYHNNGSQTSQVRGMTEKELPLISEMFEIIEGNTEIANSKGIIISEATAEVLGLRLGNYCNLRVQTIDGSANLDEFVVKGIFRYTSMLNKFSIYMDYNEAKLLYHTNLPSKIIINSRDLDKAKDIKAGLLNQLGCTSYDVNQEVEYEGINVSSYLDHIGTAKTLSTINKYGMLSIAFFLIMISFIGIWSMQTENINERQREIGSLLSFGFKKSAVKLLVIYESFFISCLFFLIGLVIVVFSVLMINLQDGIYLGESASFAFGSTIVNPELTMTHIVTVFILAAVYPLIATVLSLQAIDKRKIIELVNN